MSRVFENPRAFYQDVSASFHRTTTDGSIQPLIKGKPGYTIYVQLVSFVVHDSNGVPTWTIQDTSPTPVVLAFAPASVGQSAVWNDYSGPSGIGIPVGEGQDINLNISGPGASGAGVVVAYMKQTSPLSPSDQL